MSPSRSVRRVTPASRVFGALAGFSLGAAAAGVVAASAGVTAAVMAARAFVRPPDVRSAPLRVYGYDAQRGLITLARTARSAAPGEYTIVYADGQGTAGIGPVTAVGRRVVTRRVGEPLGAPLTGVSRVRLESAPQRGPGDLGLPWYETRVETELGPAAAWVFPAGEDEADWAVHVHGRAAAMTETLRSVPLFRRAGWSSIVVSYRNDPQAPASPDRRYGLGFTEWRDAAAAIDWCVAHGARRVLLSGWSMGGAAVLQLLARSSRAGLVSGVMLESPVLSWFATLRAQGRRLRLPAWVIRLAVWFLSGPLASAVTGLEAPLPLADGEIADRAERLRIPVLLLYSQVDETVPAGPAARLAAARPDLVRAVAFADAQHTRLWNIDPDRWEGAVRDWLGRFGTGKGAQPDGPGEAAVSGRKRRE